MIDLPSGTVTFLFTDIEGSTQLAQAQPDKWESVRERHDAILQSAMDAHNGFIFQIIGDAFCVAFHTAGDAVRAALKAQTDLVAEKWGESIIKVRMGIHTGNAEIQTGHDYHGYLTLSRVQRVMSIAYGGQILISNTSGELIRGELPEGVSLLDMKEHRLKGLLNPEHLWQAVAPNLPKDFPPLKSLNGIPNNLPVQLTSFIGREKEIVELKHELTDRHLVTLTGSGGVGKTRLSLQVAAEVMDAFPDGVWFLELAPISDPALVPNTLANLLGLRDSSETRQPIDELIYGYLHSRKALLVFDNCEHLIEACARFTDQLLHACKNVRILASSREALGVAGEMAWHVPSLSLPDLKHLPTIGQLPQYEAVRLFIERATLVQPHFAVTNENAPAVAQICSRLDGIPLAIELAAARVKVLKAEQIAERLNDRFHLLTGGSRTALPRQQTLRAMIDWSYSLLSDEERTVLRRLSVFVGGWTLEAAEAICGNADTLDLITHLVDKSLVSVDLEHGDEPRYYFLETIRQYAREKLLESQEGAPARKSHLEFYMRLAEDIEIRLQRAGQMLAYRQLVTELENIRAALAWSLGDSNGDSVEEGLRLASAIDWDDLVEEGLKWLQAGLAKIIRGNPDTDLIRAKALKWAGRCLILTQNALSGRGLLEESLAIYQAINPQAKHEWIHTLLGLAFAFIDTDYLAALNYAEEGLAMARRLGDLGKWDLAWALYWVGCVRYRQHVYETARKHTKEALEIFRQTGDDISTAETLMLFSWIESAQENYEAARSLLIDAQQIFSSADMKFRAMNVVLDMAHNNRRAGCPENSRADLEKAIEYYRDTGNRSQLSGSLNELGISMSKIGEYKQAAEAHRESLRLVRQTENPRLKVENIFNLAEISRHLGNLQKAARLLGTIEFEIRKELWALNSKFMEQYAQDMDVARTELGEQAFTAAYSEGQAMTMEQAIEFALEETHD